MAILEKYGRYEIEGVMMKNNVDFTLQRVERIVKIINTYISNPKSLYSFSKIKSMNVNKREE